MITLIISVVIILLAIGLTSKKPEHTYNAEWGSGYEHISMFNHGFSVTGSKALTRQASYENLAVFGQTGSGKSSTIIIPSIYFLAKQKSTIIINDVSSEVYRATSGFLASQGYRILRLDLSNAQISEAFNPLALCKTISDIQKLMLILVKNSGVTTNGDLFWEQSGIMLLSLFGRYLVFHTEPEFCTLQNVLRLIEKFAVDGKAVDRLFVKTGDEELLGAYKVSVAIPDKTLQSIIATARTALSLFTDPEVCKATALNSIDFTWLRAEPVALFISNPLKDLDYFKPIAALFFQSLFNHVLSVIPPKDARSIFFIVEEFASMRFPSLSTTISNIRKYRGGILLCMQDEMSLISQYGQAEAHQIKTNCGCQVYLKTQPLHTAKELSQLLGKHTYTDDKGVERIRELMTPDEIRMSDEAIVLISNKAPLKCKTIPYYKNMWLRRHAKLPPYHFIERSAETSPLIPFI